MGFIRTQSHHVFKLHALDGVLTLFLLARDLNRFRAFMEEPSAKAEHERNGGGVCHKV